MQPVRRAVIDIGTNSIKLLVAEISGPHIKPLWEESEQTRLGKGFYKTHLLQKDALMATAYHASQFASIARSHRAQTIRVIATSAARDALNQVELIQAIERTEGLHVDVIPGEVEAAWAYRGVNTNPHFDGRRLLIMDVGGGSAEFILGEGANVEFTSSFKLGTLRLQEMFRPSDPPKPEELSHCRQWLKDFFVREIRPGLDPVMAPGKERTILVGTGGTTSILTKMENCTKDTDIDVIENTHITLEALARRVECLWSMLLSDRKRLIGLKKKKADVILFGAAIYEASLRELGFPEMRVSTRGLRHAALLT